MDARTIFRVAAAALSSAALAFSSASAQAQQVYFFDDFDGGGTASWSSTQNVSTTDPGSLFGSNVFYFDGAFQSDRYAVTPTLNLSAGNVVVTFLLRYESDTKTKGDSSDVSQFDKFEDEATDDILLQYSTNGGSTWITATTFDDKDDSYRLGLNFSSTLPSGAAASSVLIRVFQSGTKVASSRDQWAIDDFTVLATPEPATWALFGLGTAGLGAWVQRRRARRRGPVAPLHPTARPPDPPSAPPPG